MSQAEEKEFDLKKSSSGVEYKLNKDGSLTFYPTKNIELGKKKFSHSLFVNSKQCPKNIEGVFDYNKKIIQDWDLTKTTNNPFINCCQASYAQHYPLYLKPEYIFLLIAQGIAIHVDKNAEKLRKNYVSHKGKKKLVINTGTSFKRGSTDNNWNGVITEFVSQIDQYSNKDVKELFDCNFSQSTLTEKVASKITLMSTVKNYFEFEMISCVCGFPQITLGGNISDWISLKEKCVKLLNNKVTKKFGEKWSKSLIPILDRFIDAFHGNINMVFWNSMIYKGQWFEMVGTGVYGMGGEVEEKRKYLSGWINVFFPYLGENKKKNDWDKSYENQYCFQPYQSDKNADEQYKNDQKIKLRHPKGPIPSAFFESMASAPVIWDYYGQKLDLDFCAGIVGFEQNHKTFELMPTVGWYIKEAEKQPEKPKWM